MISAKHGELTIAQNIAKMADLEAEVARLLQQIPTAGSNADQLELLQRAREIALNRDPSGAVLRVALPFLQTLLHQQNAPLVAAILQLLGDATPRNSAVCLDVFEAVSTVLVLSYSTEKNVLRALDLATLHLLDAFQLAATTTDNSISSDLWQRMATAIDHAADVLLSTPILLHTDNDNNNRSAAVFLRVWKLLERAVLLLSEAKEATVYRDPARSNVQPDAITVDLVSPTHSSLNRDTLLAQGDALLRRMIDRLLSTPAGAEQISRREICVAINSLSMVAAMRPQLVGIVIPALIAFHATAPPDRAVHSTLKANLVKLLSLPASLELADEVTECVIALGDGERAFRAISKSKDPKNRRKYVSAPSEASLRKARIGKRTAEQISESADAKRARVPESASAPAATAIDERVTHDGLVNMQSTTVVELVLEGFAAALPPPPHALQLLLPPSEVKSRMASLLARLATPSSVLALEKSLRRSRDPRRIHQSNNNHQQPSLVPILDDEALEETSDWISKNTTTVEEPIVSVADDNSIQVFLKPVSAAWCRDMAAAALTRILENEYGASLRGDDALREALVCRLAASPWLLLTDERNNIAKPADKVLPPVYQTVLDFVLQDAEHRAPLACALLRHEFVRVSNELLSEDADGEEPQDAPPRTGDSIYRATIAYFLPALLTSLDLSASSDKKLFGSVIASVPRVTAEVLDVILRLFADPFKSAGGAVLGITVLRDLVRERASCSTYALKLLLKFTGDADESTRNASIRCVANQLYVMETLKPSIEDHAQHLVKSLESQGAEIAAAADDPTTDHNTEDQDVDMSEPSESSWLATRVARLRADEKQYAAELRDFVAQAVAPEPHAIDSEAEVLRRVELLLALSARKPSLLVPLVAAYAATTELARQVIFQAIEKLIKHWKQRAGGVAQVVAQLHGFPPASLGLVSHIVQLLSTAAPTAGRKDAAGNSNAELVSHVLQLYETYAKEQVPDGVAVMLPLLSSVPPPTLEPLLPALLSLPTNKWSVALTRVFDALPPQPLGPMDLLLSLHHVDLTQDATMQKKVIAAVNFCVEHRHAFPAEALLHVCKLLVQESRIPKLALRTLILSVTTYPSLQQDAARLLHILAERQVWSMDEEALWKGFVKCAALLQPASFPVLLSLPLLQLEGVLRDEQELRPLLRSYVESEDKPQDLVVDDAVKELLLQVPEAQGDVAEPMEQEDDSHQAQEDS